MNYTPSKFHPSDPAYDPPPEPEYFLKGKPFGFCTWCGLAIENRTVGNGVWFPTMHDKRGREHDGCEWDISETETENRIRYAAERLEDAMGRQP